MLLNFLHAYLLSQHREGGLLTHSLKQEKSVNYSISDRAKGSSR